MACRFVSVQAGLPSFAASPEKSGGFAGKPVRTADKKKDIFFFISQPNITLRISNLIGRGLPCHGSRCRFESDLIRGLDYIVYTIYSLFLHLLTLLFGL